MEEIGKRQKWKITLVVIWDESRGVKKSYIDLSLEWS